MEYSFRKWSKPQLKQCIYWRLQDLQSLLATSGTYPVKSCGTSPHSHQGISSLCSISSLKMLGNLPITESDTVTINLRTKLQSDYICNSRWSIHDLKPLTWQPMKELSQQEKNDSSSFPSTKAAEGCFLLFAWTCGKRSKRVKPELSNQTYPLFPASSLQILSEFLRLTRALSNRKGKKKKQLCKVPRGVNLVVKLIEPKLQHALQITAKGIETTFGISKYNFNLTCSSIQALSVDYIFL